VAAPIILVLLRVIQGFSSGGEYGGAATFMAEYAPDRRRGFFGSFLEFGTLAGMAAGSLFVLLLQLGLDRKSTRLNSSHVSISYASCSLSLHDALPICRSPDHPRAAARHPGILLRRRVRRRRDLHGRIRSRSAAWVLRQLPRIRHSGRNGRRLPLRPPAPTRI